MDTRRIRTIRTGCLLSGALFVAFSCGCVIVFLTYRQPLLEGRTAHSWVRDMTSGGMAQHTAAARLFLRQGSNAVPGLVAVIDRKGLRVANWVQQLPFRLRHRLPKSIRRWADEHTAIHDLERVWAIRMCAQIGPNARVAKESLERAVADPNSFVRGEAARALARTGSDPEHAIPLIASLLTDPDASVRSQSAIALGEYHGAARAQLAGLNTLTTDADARVSFSARLAVALIESPDKVIVTHNDEGELGYQMPRANKSGTNVAEPSFE